MLTLAIKKDNIRTQTNKKHPYSQLHAEAISQNGRIKKDKNGSNISFEAYRGGDFYGTEDIRSSFNYKIKLNPEKINEIMKKAPSTDEGLVTVYKALVEESSHINDTFMGISVMNKQYLLMSKDRIGEIAKDYPKGSRTLFVGIAVQAWAKFTNGFMKRITGYTNDLIEDYNQIVDQYFNKGISPMIKDYVEVSQYAQDGIKYVNMRNGDSTLRNDLLEGIKNSQEIYTQRHKELGEGLTALGEHLSNATNKVLEEQAKRQNKRLGKKALIKVITWGMG